MKKYFERLSELILMEVNRRNCTFTYFADICEISRDELRHIIDCKKDDVKLSTIKKICDNSEFDIEDVFEPRTFEDYISTIIIEKDGVKYKIRVEKIR